DVLTFEMSRMLRRDDGCAGAFNELIANGASQLRSGNTRDGGNPFLGSAKRATSAWDLPAVRDACLGKSDFLMAELKTGNACVGIVASVGDIRSTYQPFVRLLVTMMGYCFETMPRSRKTSAAAVVDEAQNLGPLRIVETGPFMRKHELQLLLGWQ